MVVAPLTASNPASENIHQFFQPSLIVHIARFITGSASKRTSFFCFLLCFAGFFIDDDLYDDILGMADEDYVAPEESDSSWGSDEWDTFSEDSDTDDQVHSYVDPNETSSRGIVEHGGSSHSRTFVSAYGIDRSPSKEEPKVGLQSSLLCQLNLYCYCH